MFVCYILVSNWDQKNFFVTMSQLLYLNLNNICDKLECVLYISINVFEKQDVIVLLRSKLSKILKKYWY